MPRKPRSQSVTHAGSAIGMAERLALYVFGVACLISFILDSPVPMAIAP